MISDITGIDYKLLKDNITLETNELPISRLNEKAKRCDFIIRVNDNNIINLELNKYSYTGLVVKNLSYLFNLFSTSFKSGENYNENLIVMQINLNCFKDKNFNDIKPLSRYHLREDDTAKLYTKNVVIYELNVVKCHDIYYNKNTKEIPNYIRWGALLYCNNIKDIPDITKNILTYKERNQIMDKLNKLKTEDLFMTETEALQWSDWEKNTIYNDGKKEGINQGINQGIEQNTEFTIKNMLKKNISLEDISDITGKTIEEIKKYKEN